MNHAFVSLSTHNKMLIRVLSSVSTLFSEASVSFSAPKGVQLNCQNEPSYFKIHSP